MSVLIKFESNDGDSKATIQCKEEDHKWTAIMLAYVTLGHAISEAINKEVEKKESEGDSNVR